MFIKTEDSNSIRFKFLQITSPYFQHKFNFKDILIS